MMLGFGDSGKQIHNWTSEAKTKGTLGPNDTDKMVKLCTVAHTRNPRSTWEVKADRELQVQGQPGLQRPCTKKQQKHQTGELLSPLSLPALPSGLGVLYTCEG